MLYTRPNKFSAGCNHCHPPYVKPYTQHMDGPGLTLWERVQDMNFKASMLTLGTAVALTGLVAAAMPARAACAGQSNSAATCSGKCGGQKGACAAKCKAK